MHCEPFSDAEGRVTGFVCGPSKKAKPCAFCGKPSTRLCDGKWVLGGIKAPCNKPICDVHRKALPGDRDYCPECEQRTRSTAGPKTEAPKRFAQKLVDWVATVTQLDPERGQLPNAEDWRRNAEKLFENETSAVAEEERKACVMVALAVAAEAKTEQGGNAAREIARRIRDRRDK
jgi:hypothetical protein